mgnify:CR=1 FL=1
MRKTRFVAMLLVIAFLSTMVFSFPSTVRAAFVSEDFQTNNTNELLTAAWGAGAALTGGSVDNSLNPLNYTLKVSGVSAANKMMNSMNKTSQFTFKFRFYAVSTSGLKAGIKLYSGGTSSTNEVARVKFDGGAVRYGVSLSGSTVGYNPGPAPYTENTWHEVALVITPSTTNMLTDIYLDGTRVNTGLTNLRNADTIDYFNIFTDSMNSSSSYIFIDDMLVEDGDTGSIVAPTPSASPTPSPAATPVPSPIATVSPTGYPAPNIYGAGLQGYTVQTPAPVTGRTINITTFGAAPNDGQDDTLAIRNAIEAAVAGDEVYFPNGTYDLISNDAAILSAKTDVSLRGESQSGVVLKANITESYTVKSHTLLDVKGKNNLKISNLTLTSVFTGNYSTATNGNNPERGNLTYGINLDVDSSSGTAVPAYNVLIENLTIENFTKIAIRTSRTHDVIIRGCIFQNATDVGDGGAGYGVALQGQGAGINRIGNEDDSRNNLVENNIAIGPYIRHGILLQYYTHNNLIINNTLYKTALDGIDLHGEDEYRNEIYNNLVTDCSGGAAIGVGNSGAGHDEAGPLNYIHGNTSINNKRGIDVMLGSPDTIIENNTIIGNDGFASGSGIYLGNAPRTIVKNNIISNNSATGYYAIKLDHDKGYMDGTVKRGEGDPVDSQIAYNTVTNNTYAVYVNSGSGNYFLDNSITGNSNGNEIIATSSDFISTISKNACLVALQVEGGNLNKLFNPALTNYTVYVGNDVNSITLTPHASGIRYGSITVNGVNTVSGTPLVVPVAVGTSSIPVIVVAEDGITTKAYNLKVVRSSESGPLPIAVKSLTISQTAPTLGLGESLSLIPVISPANAANKRVLWRVVDGSTNVVTVNESGVVNTVGLGVATVRAVSEEDPDTYADVVITVVEPRTPPPVLDPAASQLTVASVSDSSNDGNIPQFAIDGDMNTRWAASGDPQYIELDLGEIKIVSYMNIAWNKGDQRKSAFDITVSTDRSNWSTVFTGKSNGTTASFEAYDFADVNARYVKIIGHGNYANANDAYNPWNSIWEVMVMGKPYTGGPIPTPIPTPTPNPTPTPYPVTGEVLQLFVDNFDDPDNYGSEGNKEVPSPWIQEGGSSKAKTSVSGSAPTLPNLVKIDSSDVLTLPLNTSAYGNIKLNYTTRASSYTKGSVMVEYSPDGGGTWTILEEFKLPAGTTSQGNTPKTKSLGNDACNNVNLKIRFRVGEAITGNMYIDSVSVTGQLIPGMTPVATPVPTPGATPTAPYPAPAGVKLYEDVEIGTAGNRTLYTSIAVPEVPSDTPMPVVVYIHGGGWNHGTRKDGLSAICSYVKKGYIGVSLDYRLTPEAPFPAQIQDVKLAIRYLRAHAQQYNIDPDRIGAWGSSAGSHLAALLGTSADLTANDQILLDNGNRVNVPDLEGSGGWQEYSDRIQAVIDFFGPADFTTAFANNYSSVTALLGAKAFTIPDFARLAMPGTYASSDDPPFFIRHGDADATIPYTDSEVLKNQLLSAGVPVVDYKILPGQGHGFTGAAKDAAVAEAWAFMDQHVKNRVVTEHILYKPGYIPAPTPTPTPVSVVLDATNITMNLGETRQLTATVTPAGTSTDTVIWFTYNSSIATVNTSGWITAVGIGVTKIRASVTDSVYGSVYSAECAVTVNPVPGSPDEGDSQSPAPPANTDINDLPSLLARVNDANGTEFTITIPGAGKTTPSQVTLPAVVLDKMRSKGIENLRIAAEAVSLFITPDLFGTQEASSIIIEIKQADKEKDLTPVQQQIAGNSQVYEFNIFTEKLDGSKSKVSKSDKAVEVRIAYTPGTGEDPEKITAFFLGDKGELENRGGKYDSGTGTVIFSTNHFSKYMVRYNDVRFEDLANVTWAKGPVEVMASKGIIAGNGNNTFSPERNITRGDFLLLLVKTLGLTASVDSNFSDVKSTDYYYDAIGIAKKLGLANGTGNNTFEPQKEISRQDMMVLAARAMKIANKLDRLGDAGDLQTFEDKNEIADYAALDVASLVKEGLVKGNGASIEPQKCTTRAEAAVLLYRVYNK